MERGRGLKEKGRGLIKGAWFRGKGAWPHQNGAGEGSSQRPVLQVRVEAQEAGRGRG